MTVHLLGLLFSSCIASSHVASRSNAAARAAAAAAAAAARVLRKLGEDSPSKLAEMWVQLSEALAHAPR